MKVDTGSVRNCINITYKQQTINKDGKDNLIFDVQCTYLWNESAQTKQEQHEFLLFTYFWLQERFQRNFIVNDYHTKLNYIRIWKVPVPIQLRLMSPFHCRNCDDIIIIVYIRSWNVYFKIKYVFPWIWWVNWKIKDN